MNMPVSTAGHTARLMHGEAIGIGKTPIVALSYLLVAAWMLGCARYAVAAREPADTHELHGAVTAD